MSERLCSLCRKPLPETRHPAQDLHDGCWELKTRVERDPELTRKVLAAAPVPDAEQVAEYKRLRHLYACAVGAYERRLADPGASWADVVTVQLSQHEQEARAALDALVLRRMEKAEAHCAISKELAAEIDGTCSLVAHRFSRGPIPEDIRADLLRISDTLRPLYSRRAAPVPKDGRKCEVCGEPFFGTLSEGDERIWDVCRYHFHNGLSPSSALVPNGERVADLTNFGAELRRIVVCNGAVIFIRREVAEALLSLLSRPAASEPTPGFWHLGDGVPIPWWQIGEWLRVAGHRVFMRPGFIDKCQPTAQQDGQAEAPCGLDTRASGEGAGEADARDPAPALGSAAAQQDALRAAARAYLEASRADDALHTGQTLAAKVDASIALERAALAAASLLTGQEGQDNG